MSAIPKIIGYLVGQVNCLNCYAVLEWDDPSAINIEDDTDKQFIICSRCHQNIYLNPNINYFTIKWIPNEEQDNTTSNRVSIATVDNAIL